MGNFLTWVVWLLAAAACLGTGLRVVTASNPFASARSRSATTWGSAASTLATSLSASSCS